MKKAARVALATLCMVAMAAVPARASDGSTWSELLAWSHTFFGGVISEGATGESGSNLGESGSNVAGESGCNVATGESGSNLGESGSNLTGESGSNVAGESGSN